MSNNETLIFWGAGATRDLGIRTTEDQGKFFQTLINNDQLKDLKDRVNEALGDEVSKELKNALYELLMILGDDENNKKKIDSYSKEQIRIGKKNWDVSEEDVSSQILTMRIFYDWPALKALLRISPGIENKNFKINDLFNIIDMHSLAGFGVRARETGNDNERVFLDNRRLVGAKNMLRMLLGAVFYIDYQNSIQSRTKKEKIKDYISFFEILGRCAQNDGLELAHQEKFSSSIYYKTKVNFISLNYDPLALWFQFIANRKLNSEESPPHVGYPAVPIQLFNEMGHMIPSRRIAKGSAESVWYPMNEAAAQRMNEHNKNAIRLTKTLFPHGSLCWRECPDCGKLSSYLGDEWGSFSPSLIPPPPLRVFDKQISGNPQGNELKLRKMGKVDARACLHCGTITYAYHTQTVMQSSFKSSPPSFIEEIQRDFRAIAMKSNHIIFMGYSLPLDDVSYRAFLSARCKKEKDDDEDIRCSIVVGKSKKYARWMGPNEIEADAELLEKNATIQAARDIFGLKNIRFYGGGIPNVFMENNCVSESAINYLMCWH